MPDWTRQGLAAWCLRKLRGLHGFVGLLALVLLGACPHALGQTDDDAHTSSQTQIVTRAQRTPGLCSSTVVPPAPSQEAAVALPDDWRADGMRRPGEACYRLALHLTDAPSQPWALRFDRLPGNHRISVNGVALRTHHMNGAQPSSLDTLPALIEVPASLLRSGANAVEVDVRMGSLRKPGLSSMSAGPLAGMRSPFDVWQAWVVDLPRSVNLAVATTAFLLLLVWRPRPRDQAVRLFCALMFIMGARNALSLQETTALPQPVVEWLLFSSHALGTYCLAGFGLAYAGLDPKRAAWPMRIIGLGLPLVALATVGTPSLDLLRLIAYPLMLLAGAAVITLVIRHALRQHWQEAAAMSLGPLAGLIAVAHDYLFLTPWLPTTALLWAPYVTPVLFVGYAIRLMRQFALNMMLAERMQQSLEERVRERTLALESANQSKTRFLAAASHDLRQPTAAIGLLVSLLRQQPAATTQMRDLTNMLDEAVASMESLLVGLLDISRLDAGAVQAQFQAVSLHDVFQAVKVHEQSAAEARGLSLRFRLPRGAASHGMVLTDPLLIHSVLRNLVANAIRYTQRGGVLVAARRCGKRRIRIEVWDTGIGIAHDQLERIFEEFYQVGNMARDRSRGIGLGLAIVRRTAQILGEQVKVRSRLGRGSVFTIELPLHHAAPVTQPAPISHSQPLRGRTLWLVEDDPLLRRAMSETLQSWGAHVRHWHDGETLLGELNLLLGIDRQSTLPDALITDYRLQGIDGVSLSQSVALQLAVQGHAAPTLIVSGDTDPAEIARLSASGLHVLAKPFRSERLLAQLLTLLQGSAPPQHAAI